jgi:4-hydroxythreonine-4-phosphate dehydrogenase
MRTTAPVAVTCGDPSGIGYDVILGAWQALRDEVPFFVIGDPAHLPEDAAAVIIECPAKAGVAMQDGLPMLPHAFPRQARPGHPAPDNARAVVEVIARAVTLVQDKQAAALTTAPISKKELADHAGFAFPGHTEFLADLTGSAHPVMMIVSDALKVVPVTIHIPLAEVPGALSKDLIVDTLRVTHHAMERDFGIKAPRIAVAGLNPHAGEGGMLGGEDDAMIRPACAALRADGVNVTDPLPADTMFHPGARANYDVAVCMYHDQALVPAKTLAFDTGVNVTLGLPIVRTSPDHGTAFDIAGQGLAKPSSMIEAIRLAASMAAGRAA